MNDRPRRGNGTGMTRRSLGLTLLTAALLAPTTAAAEGDPVRVLVRGSLEPTAVAAAIADELGVATSIVTEDDACHAPCAAITIDAARVASIHLRGTTGTHVRTIELPASERAATDVVALVVGNLARDESAALLAALTAATPAPEPAPLPPVISPALAPSPSPAPAPSPAPDPERPRPRGVSLGFLPFVAIDIGPGHNLAIDLVAGARRRTYGVNLAGVGGVTGEVHGTQIGGAFAVAHSVDGGQIGGAFAIAREIRGAQIAGAIAAAGPVRGVQLGGAIAAAADVRGAQIAGALATAFEVQGTQVAGALAVSQGHVGTQVAGALNVATGTVRGVQVAPFNYAGRVDGVQVGVVNVSRAGDGLSLGLLNVVRGGRTELEATLDDHAVGALVLRHGGRRWHNVYGVAARTERTLFDEAWDDDDMWMYGLGFGPSWRAGAATTVDVELMAWHVFYGTDVTEELDGLAQLRAVVGHRLGPASLVVGGALNAYITTDEARAGYGARLVPGAMPPARTDDVRVDVWPSVFAGVRL